jgi:hypothetical protein
MPTALNARALTSQPRNLVTLRRCILRVPPLLSLTRGGFRIANFTKEE